jgi:hypothetical protein
MFVDPAPFAVARSGGATGGQHAAALQLSMYNTGPRSIDMALLPELWGDQKFFQGCSIKLTLLQNPLYQRPSDGEQTGADQF